MSKIVRLSSVRRAREEIRDQACDWLARLDKGASTEDREQLRAWLSQDPVHAETLLQMAALWDRMSVLLSRLSDLFPLEQYLADSCQHVRRRRKRFAGGVAAALALLVLSASLFLTPKEPQQTESLRVSVSQSYETAPGEQSSVQLPDGSEVILNTSTLIEIQYSTESRSVFLRRGEAHFTVASIADRPFRVHAGTHIVEAVGTAFSVYLTSQNNLEVTVTRGQVNLRRLRELVTIRPPVPNQNTDPGPETLLDAVPLVAGEHAIVNESIEKKQMAPEEMEIRLAWRHGMLVFQSDPLEHVLAEVTRYTTTTIEADADVRDIRVSGYFRAGDIDGLLAAIRQNFQIDARRISQNHVLLTAIEEEASLDD